MDEDEPFFGSYPSGDATHGANRQEEAHGIVALLNEYRRRWAITSEEAWRDIQREAMRR